MLASDPDTVEITFPSMKMVSVEYDRDAVAIDLAIDPLVTRTMAPATASHRPPFQD